MRDARFSKSDVAAKPIGGLSEHEKLSFGQVPARTLRLQGAGAKPARTGPNLVDKDYKCIFVNS